MAQAGADEVENEDEFEGCGLVGRIRGMFLADFHPKLGPRIRLQTDPALLPPDTFKTLFSDYIIPKQGLSSRHVTVNALGYKVVGYPIVLSSSSYPRNEFIFNLCFVCFPWSRTVLYERAVEKFSRYLVYLEHERQYLSDESESSNDEVLAAMRDAVQQLNATAPAREARLRLGSYEVQLWAPSPEGDAERHDPLHPSVVKGHHVPVPVRAFDLAGSDLTVQQLAPHLNGFKHIRKIAFESGVHIDLVAACVRDLVKARQVRILPIFQYSNCYTPTRELARLRRDPELRRQLVAMASEDPANPLTFRQAHRVVTEFKYAASVTAVMRTVALTDAGAHVSLASLRRMVLFLQLEGVLKRVHRFPIWEPPSSAGGGGGQEGLAGQSTPVDMREKMRGGTASMDEICCHFSMDTEVVDGIIEVDPCVTIIYK